MWPLNSSPTVTPTNADRPPLPTARLPIFFKLRPPCCCRVASNSASGRPGRAWTHIRFPSTAVEMPEPSISWPSPGRLWCGLRNSGCVLCISSLDSASGMQKVTLRASPYSAFEYYCKHLPCHCGDALFSGNEAGDLPALRSISCGQIMQGLPPTGYAVSAGMMALGVKFTP